jgi:hypothetical protein
MDWTVAGALAFTFSATLAYVAHDSNPSGSEPPHTALASRTHWPSRCGASPLPQRPNPCRQLLQS